MEEAIEIEKLRKELEDIADIRVGRSKERIRGMVWEALERSEKEYKGDNSMIWVLRQKMYSLTRVSPQLTNYRINIQANSIVDECF